MWIAAVRLPSADVIWSSNSSPRCPLAFGAQIRDGPWRSVAAVLHLERVRDHRRQRGMALAPQRPIAAFPLVWPAPQIRKEKLAHPPPLPAGRVLRCDLPTRLGARRRAQPRSAPRTTQARVTPTAALSKTLWRNWKTWPILDCRRRRVPGRSPERRIGCRRGCSHGLLPHPRPHAAARADDQRVWRPVRVARDVPSLATSAPMRWYRDPNSLGRVSMT